MQSLESASTTPSSQEELEMFNPYHFHSWPWSQHQYPWFPSNPFDMGQDVLLRAHYMIAHPLVKAWLHEYEKMVAHGIKELEQWRHLFGEDERLLQRELHHEIHKAMSWYTPANCQEHKKEHCETVVHTVDSQLQPPPGLQDQEQHNCCDPFPQRVEFSGHTALPSQ